VETEKKTANYWRFKHENFRQGRPDLLTEIKRMNGKVATDTSSTTHLGAGLSPASLVPDTVLSVHGNNAAGSKAGATIQVAEKSEVLKLKKRIDEMTKNIDKLTEMVQKVTLQHVEDGMDDETTPGSKRKKATLKENQPDPGAVILDLPMPDEAYSSHLMDIEEFMQPSATELMISSPDEILSASSSSSALLRPYPSGPLSRESSADLEFVDQLFTAFHEDEDVADWLIAHNDQAMNDVEGMALPNEGNRPDPELMRRLSDALQLLPRDIQEMIVNRLIEAITSTEGLDLPIVPESPATATPTPPTYSAMPAACKMDVKKVASAAKSPSQQPLPLAAATLAALLHHYSSQIKESSSSPQPTKLQTSKKNINTLPVIPVHA
jgi:hypothetical protein